MAVRIRLARHGRLHRPFYRIVVLDGRVHREGKETEVVGIYDPLLKGKTITVDIERIGAWVAKGALVSEPLAKLLKHEGYTVPAFAGKARAKKAERAATKVAAKAKAKPAAKTPKLAGDKAKYGTASRRAVLKHAKAAKAAKKAAAPAAEAPAQA
ncbi:MAG: hypothetical protein RLZZ127_594 [Planctomycetota bacterium]|jgi:small subunit ribosomal protein S16